MGAPGGVEAAEPEAAPVTDSGGGQYGEQVEQSHLAASEAVPWKPVATVGQLVSHLEAKAAIVDGSEMTEEGLRMWLEEEMALLLSTHPSSGADDLEGRGAGGRNSTPFGTTSIQEPIGAGCGIRLT